MIDAWRFHPTPTVRPRHLQRVNSARHSPTQNKRQRIATIKATGAVRICVTAPIYLPGPTNPRALHIPTRLRRGAPHGHPRGPARVASCHMSTPPAPRLGHTRPYHVASVLRRIRPLVPRATLAPRHVS